MAELLIVLFVALIALGIRLVWLHDTSRNCYWHRNVWAVAGVCSAVVGVFGTIFSLGSIYGGVLNG